jgi:orotidine-5'-phosphate decarboxylase
MKNIVDILIERIAAIGNPTAVGLDTLPGYLPDSMKACCRSPEDAASAILDFNLALIERLSPIVPAAKVQWACYAMLGAAGVSVFAKTIAAARSAGMLAIADAKCNDIGSTAAMYSAAFLGKTTIGNNEYTMCDSDFLTINAYLGDDGVQPFVDDCAKYNKGLFVLVKTSNPSSSQLQNKRFEDGRTLYETIGGMVEVWGQSMRGNNGYSSLGAVVGATHSSEARQLRNLMPHTFFLIPGYGAQGGTAVSAAACFDSKGGGGIVNNSRGIINAHNTSTYKGMRHADAAYAAAIDMREELIKYAGK